MLDTDCTVSEGKYRGTKAKEPEESWANFTSESLLIFYYISINLSTSPNFISPLNICNL